MQGFLVIQSLLSEVELKDRGTSQYCCPDVLFEELYQWSGSNLSWKMQPVRVWISG